MPSRHVIPNKITKHEMAVGMPESQPAWSLAAGGKRIPIKNPNFATQPGVRKIQMERRNSISSEAISGTSPQRHGAVSPAQLSHDTATLMRDLLETSFILQNISYWERLLKAEAKVETAEENRTKMRKKVEDKQVEMEKLMDELQSEREVVEKLKADLHSEKVAGERKDMEIKKLTGKLTEMEERKRMKQAGEEVIKKAKAENDEEMKNEKHRLDEFKEETAKLQEEMNSMVTKGEEKTKERRVTEVEMKEQLRQMKECVKKLEKMEVTGDRRRMARDVTMATEAVGSSDCLWERTPKDGDMFIILTDSNGACVTADTIRRYIPREKRCTSRIRVHTTYTLFEVFEKVGDERIKVEGAEVILDVSTNDVRGTRGLPRVTPEEVSDRVWKVVATLKEKGASGVTVCETKPMKLMDVTPYSNLLQQRCRERKVGWCPTQLAVDNLKEDGYHVLPSFLQVLDATYACIVMGVQVPNPTPNFWKWRHQLQEQEREKTRGEGEKRTEKGLRLNDDMYRKYECVAQRLRCDAGGDDARSGRAHKVGDLGEGGLEGCNLATFATSPGRSLRVLVIQ
jgi:hypothetical protein